VQEGKKRLEGCPEKGIRIRQGKRFRRTRKTSKRKGVSIRKGGVFWTEREEEKTYIERGTANRVNSQRME